MVNLGYFPILQIVSMVLQSLMSMVLGLAATLMLTALVLYGMLLAPMAVPASELPPDIVPPRIEPTVPPVPAPSPVAPEREGRAPAPEGARGLV